MRALTEPGHIRKDSGVVGRLRQIGFCKQASFDLFLKEGTVALNTLSGSSFQILETAKAKLLPMCLTCEVICTKELPIIDGQVDHTRCCRSNCSETRMVQNSC